MQEMTMDDVLKKRELVSALADGQLRGNELVTAIRLAATEPDAQASWHAYHLAGDVMRSAELCRVSSDEAFMARLRTSLAAESVHDDAPLVAGTETNAARVMHVDGLPAANESNFSWKLVAGFASLAAVVAIAWNAVSTSNSAGGQAELAMSPVSQPAVVAVGAPSQPVSQEPQTQTQVTVAGSPQVMIRDARLDELLFAHRQFGGTSALQMPAGFLRNATFEGPGR
jgi:sigma-E factor negative regulatory protein RseA